jgi:hypothetical protein
MTRDGLARLMGPSGVPTFLPKRSRSLPMVEAPARRGRATRRRASQAAMALLVCWMGGFTTSLLGYAVLSKGWAYVGVPPVFIGEVLLLSGVVVLLACTPWWTVFEVLPAWPLAALMIWGAVRTAPYLSVHKVDALRDAVIWGYGTFAFIIFGCLVAAPTMLPRLLCQYRRFTRIFLVCVPVVTILSMFLGFAMPRWPTTDTPMVYAKGGDVLVHLGAILAFWSTGLGGPVALPLVMLFTANVALMGIQSRGGLLAFLAGFLICALDRPRSRALRHVFVVTVCGFMALAAANVNVPVPGRERSISFEQFLENLASISSDSKAGDLDGTKQWRLNWWATIVDYTIHGDYFWEGKGFGVNLADDDGFQVAADHSLRSPHNGHLTILARTGVPGLFLWGLTQLAWVASLLRYYAKSRLNHHDDWSGLFLSLLVYWLGFMINATFDVFIEGPMGGIWYWSVYGVGLAGMWIYRRDPGMPLRIEGHPRAAACRVMVREMS